MELFPNIAPKTMRQSVSRIICLFAVVLAVLGLAKIVEITWPIIVVLLIAIFPWLHLFTKKIFIGDNEVVLEGDAPPTNPVPPPIADAPNTFSTLPPEGQKVIATLWRYQKRDHGVDGSRYWMFAVPPGEPSYPEYMKGLITPASRGLCTFDPGKGYVVLTPKGLQFCKDNIVDVERFPTFFGNWG